MNPLLPPAQLDAARIVRASGSSFVSAFRILPKKRREDLETFYAFCRVIDDLADCGGNGLPSRREALEVWRRGFLDPELHGLPENLRSLVRRRSLDPSLFLEILEGTETDLQPVVRMTNRADLDLYCHRVAGVVGQLCLPIFGANAQRSAPYAETLGRALQYTNILRDTASDLQRGRVYYPLEELASAGLNAENFSSNPAARQSYLDKFAQHAEGLYREADRLLPYEDRQALRPAVIMGAVYRSLLGTMQKDGLLVMEKSYRLSALAKLLAVLRGLAGRQ